MEGDPFVLIEGMTIAGIAVGATKGYIYIRSEYPHADRGDERGDRGGAARRLCSARASAAPTTPSISKCASAPAPMSAARKPRCWKAWKATAASCAPSRRCRRTRACSASRPSSTTCCRWRRCRSSSPAAPRPTPISAWAARAARCRSSSPATSSMAGCSRPPSASRSANWSTTSAAARATGRPVRAVQVGGPLGAYFPRALFDTPFDYEAFAARDGLIGHGGIVVFDDTRRHGQAGAVRDGVLRHRMLRQVHALPHRLDARRRDHRQDQSRRARRRKPRRGRRPLQHHEVRLALRARRLHALSRDERAETFPGRFRPRRRRACRPRNRGDRHVADP